MVSGTTMTKAPLIQLDEDRQTVGNLGVNQLQKDIQSSLTAHFQVQGTGSSSKWTFSENKLFENELALQDENAPERWHNIAKVTGKTVEEVKSHYQLLVKDLARIESGMVPLPKYKRMPPQNYKKRQNQKIPPRQEEITPPNLD